MLQKRLPLRGSLFYYIIPHMKRILCIITLFIIILSLSGCGETAPVEALPSPDASLSAPPILSPEVSYESNSKPLIGIDVSAWQGDIDWKAVSEDNIDFVIIRLGYRGYLEGILHTDDCFEQNIKGSESAGLLKGVYFFSQADSGESAAEEAEYVIGVLKEYELELPVVFDWEHITAAKGGLRKDAITYSVKPEEASAYAGIFCSALEQAGYETAVYISLDAPELSPDPSLLENTRLWLADLNDVPVRDFDVWCWQYDAHGSVNGINGDVDLNLLFARENP